MRDETAGLIGLIWGGREGNCFFGEGLDGANQVDLASEISVYEQRSLLSSVSLVSTDFGPDIARIECQIIVKEVQEFPLACGVAVYRPIQFD